MTASIVCGIDQSAHARTVATFAAGLAERLRLRLVLAHAVPVIAPAAVPSWPVRAPHDSTEVRAAARGAAERLLDGIVEDAGAAGAVTRLEEGPAAECLVLAALEEGARYLVVGTRGHGAAGVLATGSVSLTASRLAPCPVIVLPDHLEGVPDGETIVCGMADGEDLEPLRVASVLGRALDLQLVPAHAVPEVPDDTSARHVADIRRHVAAGLAILVGDPAEQLARLADQAHAAMVVVGSRGRGALRASVLGSVSRSLIRASTSPVVICAPNLRTGEGAQ
jgi:nucleotide-binding universal stress UspA family protein